MFVLFGKLFGLALGDLRICPGSAGALHSAQLTSLDVNCAE
nr:MAG TPA: hypothetical protein [Microviridae sp.]